MQAIRRCKLTKRFANLIKGQNYGSSSSDFIVTERPVPIHCLTEDEVIMRNSVAKLAREQISPYVKKMDEEAQMFPEVVKMLFENGLMGIEVPEEYGGTGSNFMTAILSIEEIAKVDPAVAVLVAVHNSLVCGLIMKLGTPEQKKKYLPLLAQEGAGSFCLTEATSGSDAFAMKTTATQDGDSYIINGSKMWISQSDIAQLFIVFANADHSKSYRGITAFIVERNAPGVSVGKPEKKLGIRASGTCEVNFDNVKVHKSAILGELMQGYKYAAGFLNESRVGVAAQMLGIAEGCFEVTVPYTLERKQFGKSIYEFQGLQHQISEIAVRLECAKLLVYNAARMIEAGHPFAKQASMAKYYASELAQEVTRKCIDWMGGVGFTQNFPQEKFYRDCKIGTIYEGTSNMQLSTIAKHLKKEFES